MIKYNDNNIIVGYIKQLLHTTYLPNFPVYKSIADCYEGGLYIKDSNICQVINGELVPILPYKFNTRIDNYTKTLRLDSNIYDWHTHEYLGEYLRFFRDYFKLNLMPLYNCFSGRMPENLSIVKLDETNETKKILASSSDDSSCLYIVPVKFHHTYSIYIESSNNIEVMPILYDKGYYEEASSLTTLTESGLKRYPNSSFKNPIKYDFLNPDDEMVFRGLYPFENDLKLLIKVPFNCNSSIVVLEDNLSDVRGMVPDTFVTQGETEKPDPYNFIANKSVINYDIEDKSLIPTIPLRCRSQLTYINSNVSHPFSDRLIEYLVDNVITHLDKIPDNISRVQRELMRRKYTYNKTGLTNIKYDGIWQPKYNGILYDVAGEEGLLTNNFDILGYVDKDVEIKLGEDYDLYEDLWYEESK